MISSNVKLEDLLRPAVLADLEVGRGQAAHDRAGPSRTMTSTETRFAAVRNTVRGCGGGCCLRTRTRR